MTVEEFKIDHKREDYTDEAYANKILDCLDTTGELYKLKSAANAYLEALNNFRYVLLDYDIV